MAAPNIYKKTPITSATNRPTSNLTSQEQSRVNDTISKFFELFVAKHLE